MELCNNSIIDVASERGSIYLGVWDTLNVRQQQFDVTAWLDAYGADGVLSVLFQRRGDELPYAVADVTLADGVATWTFDETDTAVVGEGKAALVYIRDGETIARTTAYPTYTAPTIGMGGTEPPDPWESWYTRILEAASAAQTAAASASASAGDAAQQARRAETQADRANTAATQAISARNEAREAASDAATAKTAAETARDLAQFAATDAQTAQGKAEAAQTAAETAQGLAETAQTAAETAESNAVAAQTAAETAQAAAEAAAATVAQTMLAAFATETQTDTSITQIPVVETDLGADNLPLKELIINIGAVQEGSGDPSPSNPRPISARTTANVIVSPTIDAEDGTTYPITLNAGGTYLAQLNVLTGELTVCAKMVTIDGSTQKLQYNVGFDISSYGKVFYSAISGANNVAPCVRTDMWGRNLLKSNMFTYKLIDVTELHEFEYGSNRGAATTFLFCFPRDMFTDAAAANAWVAGTGTGESSTPHPIDATFPLATPLTYQLTPTEVRSILGAMKLWNESGTVNTATYRLDPTLVYNSLRGA